MSTLDITDKALCAALSANTPLTLEQRSVLLTVVLQRARQDLNADRYVWLRNGDNWREGGLVVGCAGGEATCYGDALDKAIDRELLTPNV